MNPPVLTAAARVALVVAVAAIAWLATTDRTYPAIEQVSDKLYHAAAFAVLAALADLSFPAGRFGLAKIGALLGFGIAIEAVQYFLPHRQASLADVLADGVGIAFYALCAPLVAKVATLRPRTRN